MLDLLLYCFNRKIPLKRTKSGLKNVWGCVRTGICSYISPLRFRHLGRQAVISRIFFEKIFF